MPSNQPKQYRALAITAFTTAREMSDGQILLFTPSDQTEAGHISPPSEIYLRPNDILRLAEWVKEARGQ